MSFGSRLFWKHTLVVLACGIVTGILIGLLAARSYHRTHGRLSFDKRDTIRAAAVFKCNGTDRLGYAMGFEYLLLNKFAGSEGVVMQVIFSDPDSADRWKELEDQKIDIVIADARDTAADYREKKAKLSIRSGNCVWAVRRHDNRLLVNLNNWLAIYTNTREYADMESRFSRRCYLGLPTDTAATASLYSSISPYDDLIRKNANILGWDWRLLASLVCQESKFVLSVISHKKAVGLMQVRQITADYYGMPLSYDPEENIHLGTLYLSRLQNMFLADSCSREDILKFMLAAYNCGEGRIGECRSYAVSQGLDPHSWDDVAEAMSIMKDERVFNGDETLKFVQEILTRYEIYRRTVRE